MVYHLSEERYLPWRFKDKASTLRGEAFEIYVGDVMVNLRWFGVTWVVE